MNDAVKPLMVSADHLLRYLSEKGVSLTCAKCGQDRWSGGDEPGYRGVAMPVLGKDGYTTQDMLAVIPLACENCAYVWLIARPPVERWLGSQAV